MKTELVFILDRSGSMGGLESDTIGGYNAMMKKQLEVEGEVTVTTVLFDDRVETLHDRIDIHALRELTDKDYYVRGSTALMDAMGMTISRIAHNHAQMLPEHRPDKVLFVITTDGLENSSREYSSAQVKKMVEHEQEKYGWEFLFLGANIDAVETAGRIGIRESHAVNYHADSKGTQLNYEAVGEAITTVRTCSAPLSAKWKGRISRDYAQRKSER